MDNWEKTILPYNITIEDVVKNLEQSSLKICLIATPNQELIGTITDGDVRRGLLSGLDFKSPIEKIVQRYPVVVQAGIKKKNVEQIMTEKKIYQIPEINQANKIVGLHTWDGLTKTDKISNIIIIMAGGKGKRLLPETETCPKPMLMVGGKPILEIIIQKAKAEGFEKFIICVGYLSDKIIEYFSSGKDFGVEIDYVHEKKPLGTAGAISLLKPQPNEDFIVVNGDVVTDIRYADFLNFHIRQKALATMAVHLHEWQNPFGVVQLDELEIIGFQEKPTLRSYVNAGVYALSTESLEYLEKNQACDMPTIFERLRQKNKLTVAYPMHEFWLDIGYSSDLKKANRTDK